MSDVIGDMFARMKNAYMVLKPQFVVPYSNEKEAIVKVLEKNNYVTSYSVTEDGAKKTLVVKLCTDPQFKYVSIERMSKPGRRMYVRAQDIATIKGGRGIILLSTSKGIKEGKEAKKEKLGGELLAQIY
ncbi:MAG: 30S ribosomal protein S8 [Patescibacteria group bacterium]